MGCELLGGRSVYTNSFTISKSNLYRGSGATSYYNPHTASQNKNTDTHPDLYGHTNADGEVYANARGNTSPNSDRYPGIHRYVYTNFDSNSDDNPYCYTDVHFRAYSDRFADIRANSGTVLGPRPV